MLMVSHMIHAVFIIPFTLGAVSEIHFGVILFSLAADRTFMNCKISGQLRLESSPVAVHLPAALCPGNNILPKEQKVVHYLDYCNDFCG